MLLKTWLQSLSQDDGVPLKSNGVTLRMVYWADVFYDKPLADGSNAESFDSVNRSLAPQPPAVSPQWKSRLPAKDRKWVNSFSKKLQIPEGDEQNPPAMRHRGRSSERVPLPWFIKKPIIEVFLRDVHHYLFNVECSPRNGCHYHTQDEIRRRLVDALKAAALKPGPHILVSHSMGTVIAYDCLKRVPDCPKIDGLLTIGSPLGLEEIQQKMTPEWTRANGFPSDKLSGSWINVYDALDPVAGFDPKISNDYLKSLLPVIEDIHEPNFGTWRHDITKYLAGPKLRDRLRNLLHL